MRRSLFQIALTLGLIAAAISLGPREDLIAAEPSPSLSEWIQQLASPQRTIREDARQRLLAAGDAALPDLRQAEESDIEAIRFAALDLRRQIEMASARKLIETAPAGLFHIQARLSPPRPRSSGEGVLLRAALTCEAGAQLHPYYLSLHDRDLSLQCGARAAAPFNPDARREVDFTGQTAQWSVDFLAPGEPSPPLALTGKMLVRCAVRPRPLEFPLQAPRPIVRYAGENEVSLLRSQLKGGELQATLAIRTASSLNWESHRQGLLHRDAWLRSSAGQQKPDNVEILEPVGGVQLVRYTFAGIENAADNLVLFYAAPTLTTEITAPIDVRNLAFDK
jgi:hypothetical protein